MCGQTDKKFLDMCGQTDTKILDIWDTGTLKKQTKKMGERKKEEEEEKQGLEAAGLLGYRRLKNKSTRKHIVDLKMCFLGDLFFLVELFFLIDLTFT